MPGSLQVPAPACTGTRNDEEMRPLPQPKLQVRGHKPDCHGWCVDGEGFVVGECVHGGGSSSRWMYGWQDVIGRKDGGTAGLVAGGCVHGGGTSAR